MVLIFNEVRGRIRDSNETTDQCGEPTGQHIPAHFIRILLPTPQRVVTTENDDDESDDRRDVT
jgi:hypothetical protein